MINNVKDCSDGERAMFLQEFVNLNYFEMRSTS